MILDLSIVFNSILIKTDKNYLYILIFSEEHFQLCWYCYNYFDILLIFLTKYNQSLVVWVSKTINIPIKMSAPGEARTHGLQIMRLTRCLLRYRGFHINYPKFGEVLIRISKFLPILKLL